MIYIKKIPKILKRHAHLVRLYKKYKQEGNSKLLKKIEVQNFDIQMQIYKLKNKKTS